MKKSYNEIIKQCKRRDFAITKSAISRIVRASKEKNPSDERAKLIGRKQRPTPARSVEVVRKVKEMVMKENPGTHKLIAMKTGVSRRTVGRIIKKNLGLVKRHKSRGHKLTARHIAERKTHSRKLYEEHLSGEKWKNVVTLDEAWIYLTDCNKPRAIYYRPKDSKARGEFVRNCKERFSKGFMIVAGYCHKGKLQLRRVDGKAKVNAAYYQRNVLDPLFHQEIPALYGNDVANVWLHQDKASSHTAKSTTAYLTQMARETGIRTIPFSSIPVKSPDASPMDFCGFGLLKQGLGNKRPRTVEGLWKACKQVWDSIPQRVLSQSLLQWKLRCRAIARMGGKHIEQNRWWRRGFT